MCLSTVIKKNNGTEEKIAEYVSGVKAENGVITLRDVMGIETVVTGTIKSMDFIKNIIIVED